MVHGETVNGGIKMDRSPIYRRHLQDPRTNYF